MINNSLNQVCVYKMIFGEEINVFLKKKNSLGIISDKKINRHFTKLTFSFITCNNFFKFKINKIIVICICIYIEDDVLTWYLRFSKICILMRGSYGDLSAHKKQIFFVCIELPYGYRKLTVFIIEYNYKFLFCVWSKLP